MAKKIAILGGGPAGLSAALELTQGQNPAAPEFEVTVYSRGWRLGGKCATGRDPIGPNKRVEEHGLHMLGGFYENTFQLLRRCMTDADLDRELTPSDTLWLPIELNKKIHLVKDTFPVKDRVNKPPQPQAARPGTRHDQRSPTVKEFTDRLYAYIGPASPVANRIKSLVDGTLDAVFPLLSTRAQTIALAALPLDEFRADPTSPLRVETRATKRKLRTKDFARWVDRQPDSEQVNRWKAIIAASSLGTLHLISSLDGATVLDPEQRTLLEADLVKSLRLRGNALIQLSRANAFASLAMNAEGLYAGLLLAYVSALLLALKDLAARPESAHVVWETLDIRDYRTFVALHGGNYAKISVNDTSLVGSLYDWVFAYPRTDPFDKDQKGLLAAGVGLRAVLSLMFDYHGAFHYHPTRGMGDSVIAPMYLELVKRKVRFEFFHRVESLQPSADAKTIETITIARQVKLADTTKPYEPLVEARSNDADPTTINWWPNQPLAAQIDTKHSHALTQDGAREQLESAKGWPDEEVRTLTSKGQNPDFDVVILAIPVRALGGPDPGATDGIADNLTKPQWLELFDAQDGLATIPTVAAQIYLTKTVADVGKPNDLARAVTIGARASKGEFLNYPASADVSHVLKSQSSDPKSVFYFCGASGSDVKSLKHATDRFQQELEAAPAAHWPGVRDATGKLTSDALWGPNPHVAGTFADQYYRWNGDPTEQFTLSLPRTTDARLYPVPAQTDPASGAEKGTGYANLYCVGDWVRSGWNCGAFESAVTSARIAVRHLRQQKTLKIYGVDDLV